MLGACRESLTHPAAMQSDAGCRAHRESLLRVCSSSEDLTRLSKEGEREEEGFPKRFKAFAAAGRTWNSISRARPARCERFTQPVSLEHFVHGVMKSVS